MPEVNIERATELDKVHAQRMLHAHSQVLLRLIGLQIPEVDSVLSAWGIAIFPGPNAGIEYPVYAKQLHADRLKALNAKRDAAAKKAAPKPKPKAKRK